MIQPYIVTNFALRLSDGIAQLIAGSPHGLEVPGSSLQHRTVQSSNFLLQHHDIPLASDFIYFSCTLFNSLAHKSQNVHNLRDF